MLSIEIKAEDLEFNILTYDRVCILLGKSGIGKSYMYNLLTRKRQPPGTIAIARIDDYELSRKEIMDIDSAGTSAFLNFGNREDLKYGRLLYIVDDDDSEQSKEATRLLSSTVNSYFLIISRNKSVAGINYDIRSIYTLELSDNGKKHMAQRLLNQFEHSLYPDKIRYNDIIIISEDSKAGLQFYARLCKSSVTPIINKNGVISGKDNLVNILREIDLQNKTLVLFVDWCSYGSNFNDLLSIKKKYGDTVDFIFNENILSFEYLLLSTNLLQLRINDKPLDSILVDRTLSYEKQFQSILDSVTRGTEFHLTHHSNLPICYYAPCCSKLKNSKYCSYMLNGEKIKALFTGTIFEDILKFRRI